MEDDYLGLDINHYFLCVNDGKINYFLTLLSDLANIQNGLQTEHFGTNIKYYKEDDNGDLKQIYKAAEIEHGIITPEKLKEIDKKNSWNEISSDFEFYKWYDAMMEYPNLNDDNKKFLKVLVDFYKCITDAYDSFF